MGASAWYENKVKEISREPLRTKRGVSMKRLTTTVLDRLLNEARLQTKGLQSSCDIPMDRRSQQRKHYIDIFNKGKRLRGIVNTLGIGILFYRRIWQVVKVPQNNLETLVSLISKDSGKTAILALLGNQVEHLIRDGRPNSAILLQEIENQCLLSVEDISSLRSDYGSSMSEIKLQ